MTSSDDLFGIFKVFYRLHTLLIYLTYVVLYLLIVMLCFSLIGSSCVSRGLFCLHFTGLHFSCLDCEFTYGFFLNLQNIFLKNKR